MSRYRLAALGPRVHKGCIVVYAAVCLYVCARASPYSCTPAEALSALGCAQASADADAHSSVGSFLLADALEDSRHIARRSFVRKAALTAATTLAPMAAHPRTARALTPSQASTAYDVFAPEYDSLDGGQASTVLGIDEARASLLSQASGDVLEIGAGTGLNLANYNFSNIASLTLVDVSDGMLREAQKKIELVDSLRAVRTELVRADATTELVRIFGNNRFDTVVDSFSLCVMGNQGASNCLRQLAQVVKPKSEGGKVLLLENTRSSNPLIGTYQDATAQLAATFGGKGCVYNQDVEAIIRSIGMYHIESQRSYAAGLFRYYVCTVS